MAKTRPRNVRRGTSSRREDKHRVPLLDQTVFTRCAQQRYQERCVTPRSNHCEAHDLLIDVGEYGGLLGKIAERT